MNTKFANLPQAGAPIVYVRRVEAKDLPEEIREQIVAQGGRGLYALCDENGERIALVQDRRLAFVLARQNEMNPVNVH